MGGCYHSLKRQKQGTVTRIGAARLCGEGCLSDRRCGLQQREGTNARQSSVSLPLPCLQVYPIGQVQPAARGQEINPRRIGRNLNPGGKRTMSSTGSSGVTFFPPRILINVGLPVRNGAAIFYLPRGSLREVRFPALEPTVGTINLTNMTGSFSTVRALAKHHSSEEPSLTSLPEIASLQPCPRLPLSRHLPCFLHSTNHSLKLFVYLFICSPLSNISPLRARTLPDSAMALSVVQRITCRMCSINFG